MKLYRYIAAAIVLLTAYSCSDFLEYRDKDKVIPKTLDQYSELVYGDLIAKNMGNTLHTLEFMTDDLESYINSSSSTVIKMDERIRYYNYYLWSKEPQQTKEGDEIIDKIWEVMYEKVFKCNIIEQNVSLITPTTNDEELMKQRLIGEVQCLRAICNFYLINTYGDVYKSADQAKTALGTPINTAVGVYPNVNVRSSLAEVCMVIENDLKNALINLSKGEQRNTIFRPNADIVRLMQSRLYLMMHRYDEVITVCDELIKNSKKTIASNAFVKDARPFISKNNTGILFTWMNRDGFYTSSHYGRYINATSLVNLYVEDLRPATFFNYNKLDRQKYNINTSGTLTLNYRIEEAYFNKAEAIIQKDGGKYADALEVVNMVRAERITAKGTLLSATSKEDAWTKLKNEKRAEFCFEEIRWFDIRRWNERITHKFHDMSAPAQYVTYVLEAGSPNYVMALPQDVVKINHQIEQPKRIDSNPIAN